MAPRMERSDSVAPTELARLYDAAIKILLLRSIFALTMAAKEFPSRNRLTPPCSISTLNPVHAEPGKSVL